MKPKRVEENTDRHRKKDDFEKNAVDVRSLLRRWWNKSVWKFSMKPQPKTLSLVCHCRRAMTSLNFADLSEFLGAVQLKQIIFLEIWPRFASIIACFSSKKENLLRNVSWNAKKAQKESPKGMLLARSVSMTDGREHQQGLETTSRLTFGLRSVPRNFFFAGDWWDAKKLFAIYRRFMLIAMKEFP